MGLMTYVWAVMAVAGWALAAWARYSLPSNTVDFPVPIVRLRRTRRGPYRFLRHPMYAGTVLLFAGLGGLGGAGTGVWNALALGGLAELVTREWAWREDRGTRLP